MNNPRSCYYLRLDMGHVCEIKMIKHYIQAYPLPSVVKQVVAALQLLRG